MYVLHYYSFYETDVTDYNIYYETDGSPADLLLFTHCSGASMFFFNRAVRTDLTGGRCTTCRKKRCDYKRQVAIKKTVHYGLSEFV